MPPKRKASSSAAGGSSSSSKSTKSRKPHPQRKAPKIASPLDMFIRRSDDEADSSDDDTPTPLQQQLVTRSAQDEYEPESDEASHISSGEEQEDSEEEDVPRVKTVSATNLAFLEGLDKNKSLAVSQKDAKQKAKDLKRSDRREFEEERRRRGAEEKERLKKALEEFEEEKDEFSDEDFSEDEEEEEITPKGRKKNYQEYSDVSEGEEVGGSSDEETAPVKKNNKTTKRKGADEEEDAEAVYMARLGKRKAREQYEGELERQKRVNAKLPVRKLDGEVSDDDDLDSSDQDLDDDDQEQDEFRQDSEPEGLGSSDEDDLSTKPSQRSSRAVHAPLPSTTSDTASDLPVTTATPATLSSITHSSRFNLTAPYEILLTSHPCRLPPLPPSTSTKSSLSYTRTVLQPAAQRTLLLARNQIASLASQIISDPEVNLGLLRRLSVFASATISAPPEKIPEIRLEQSAAKAEGRPHTARPTSIAVPVGVRQMAMLSLLAVFLDILPGYRIRSLTEKEREEKVGQEVARRREFESGLVEVYKNFLQMCEAEIKTSSTSGMKTGSTVLEKAAIKVFTTLATRAVHFNFRTNILGVVVARMSRRTWKAEEEDCYQAICTVVKEDLTGEVGLEVVRLIHRMTKERRYKVNSKVLDVLLFLRLKDELGNKRSSTTTSTDPDAEAEKERREYAERKAQMKAREGKGKKGGGKGVTSKEVRKGLATHLSKKQVKKQRQLREIEDEMKEAEATVDLAERERNQTETLKLVFVLYFTVLKREVGEVGLGVLESTLKGLSMYAHRVNVDFFRDLLAVLKKHVAVNAGLLEEESRTTESDVEGSDDDDDEADNVLLDQTTLTRTIRHIILALKTIFDLFLGQIEGSILNLDLTDVLSHFYYTLFHLPFVSESHLLVSASSASIVDLALDSLYSILIKSRTRFSPHILAAFAKRLAIITLHLPVSSTSGPRKVLGLIAHLLTKQSTSASADSQLALLDLEDRSRNGHYQALGKNLATSGVLESGQTVLWELCQLTKMGSDELGEEAERIWRLKDSQQ
ncbi:Nucleolar complex-associated protein 3 [Pseudozyma hubeiensis]|nr:Nucleolar complex-associated protein 3 [Pseudozyma hubeiensis]